MMLKAARSQAKLVVPFLLVALLALVALPGCSEDDSTRHTDSGLTMEAERDSDKLQISRAAPGASKPADIEEDSWTVFVYICGSDLESEDGAATKDLSEMVGASGSEKVRFIVETGGARRWESKDVSSRDIGRYLIQDGSIMEVDNTSPANMGDAGTLADFLVWGVQNYPAERMGLILWDHGGGPISGVCFDELNDDDALVLRELDEALAKTYQVMWDKFEFIGFDACLMGSLETANVAATYANYLIASQESEPNGGWEYSSIVEYLASNPTCTGAELGRVICDSYYEASDQWDYATLSVIDLLKVDDLLQSFYSFSQELYDTSEDRASLATVVRGIREADRFGSNNRIEGYDNLVDLGGTMRACADTIPSSKAVLAALEDAVVYQVRGEHHSDASGLSLYYPLSTGDSDELQLFQAVSVNPAYIAFVDRLAHAATYGDDDYEDYSYETWTWDDAGSGGQWNFADDHSAESTVITFAHKPQLDEDGYYWFQLDESGLESAAGVSALVYEIADEDLIALGETYDVDADWESGVFYDNFDGSWLSLPDGQNLCVYVAETTDDYLIYSSPIELNGEECYLRIRQYYDDGSVEVEGAWDGVGENGEAGRGVTELKKGDTIVPLYDALTPDEEEATYVGEEYVMKRKRLKLSYEPLYASTYLYSFCIEDIYGDYLITDPVEFEVDEEGDVYF